MDMGIHMSCLCTHVYTCVCTSSIIQASLLYPCRRATVACMCAVHTYLNMCVYVCVCITIEAITIEAITIEAITMEAITIEAITIEAITI